jgi:hypothetical protein
MAANVPDAKLSTAEVAAQTLRAVLGGDEEVNIQKQWDANDWPSRTE